MKPNRVLKALREGQVVAGAFVSELRSPFAGLLLEAAGLDFMMIDMEHSPFSMETTGAMLAGCRETPVVPFVRIPELRRECVLKPLDLGAAGVLLPRVETAAEVADLIKYAKYPPAGDRSLALCRAHNEYRRGSAAEVTAAANREIMVMIQIETRRGLENVDQILAGPTPDLVFVGPSDLALCLGTEPELTGRLLTEALARIVAACAARAIPVGIHASDAAVMPALIEHGIRFLSCDTDTGALIRAWRHAGAAVHAAYEARATDPNAGNTGRN